MSINFPDSPTTGQTYTYGSRSWTWNGRSWIATSATIGYTGSASYYSISDTPPSTPNSGDRWFDSINGVELVWTIDANGGQWVEIAASGFIGFTGSSGNASAQGYTGSVGFVGSVGYAGSLGYTGSIGPTGYTGSGYTGSQGIIGYPGVRGFTGSASTVIGYTGSQGYTGSTGAYAAVGFTGSASTVAGYTGSASTVVGYTGSVGITGPTGFTGSASTVVGYTGSQGPVGISGSYAAVGYTGSQGYWGSFGYTGSAGTTVPFNNQTSAYSLQATDNGSVVSITTGGVTVPSGVFSAGQNVSIYNNSGSSQTVTQGSGVTLYLVGSALTGNRTLAQHGLATVMCVASNTFVITGGGLS